MSAKNLRIQISFKNTEKDYELYKYIQSKNDKSAWIKEVVEKYIVNENMDKSTK